jgi:NAD(P)-dependent dehydrogenase (short-subunit alcohol dehydrogenase family)
MNPPTESLGGMAQSLSGDGPSGYNRGKYWGDGLLKFSGKRIVVTGAASGIGLATAELLAREGAEVIAVDIAGEPPLECCDLSRPSDIDALVGRLDGPIHGLCNVAGLPGSHSAEQVMAVNFLGLRHLTEALLPRLADGGAVVNVASAAGSGWRQRIDLNRALIATPDFASGLAWCRAEAMSGPDAYNFSKEAVIVYTMAVSAARRERGISVNSVSPGAVETPILADFYATMDSDLLDQLKDQAGGRNGRPEEIAPAIAFLLGDDAHWINGTDLMVDGGAEVMMHLGNGAS